MLFYSCTTKVSLLLNRYCIAICRLYYKALQHLKDIIIKIIKIYGFQLDAFFIIKRGVEQSIETSMITRAS
jgi:hypothetical protein